MKPKTMKPKTMKPKRPKIISLFLALLIVFTAFSVPVSAASYRDGVYTLTINSRIRSNPDQNSRLVGNIAKGTRFKVTKINGEWGYTPRIKTSNGYKSGWSYLPHSKYEGKVYFNMFASTKGKGYSYTEAYKKRATSFKQGTSVYVWGAVVNENNTPVSAYACTLKLSIINPNNKCVRSYKYDYTDNNWIRYEFNTVGTWKIKAEFSGWIEGAGTREIKITEVKPTSVTLSNANISLMLNKGETKKLSATVYPSNTSNKSVTWTTSDSSVATVSGGTVYPQKPGVATITAKTVNGKTARCTVYVNGISIDPFIQPFYVEGLHVGDIYYLTTTSRGVSEKVKWKSSKSSVLSVNSKGMITAKKEGKATITVTTNDGYSSSTTIWVSGVKTVQEGSISNGGYTTVRLNANKKAGYIKIRTKELGGIWRKLRVHVVLRDDKGNWICEFDTYSKEKLKLGNDHSEYRVYIQLPKYPDNPVGDVASFFNEFDKWKVECVSDCYIA